MSNSVEGRLTHPFVQLTNNSTVRSTSKLGQSVYIQPNPRLHCIFCDAGNHSSHECWRFKSSTSFWEKVSVDRRCKNCLRLFHKSNRCFDKSFCLLDTCRRSDKHSPIVCHARYVKYYLNFYRPNIYSRRDSRVGGISCETFRPPKFNPIFAPNSNGPDFDHTLNYHCHQRKH